MNLIKKTFIALLLTLATFNVWSAESFIPLSKEVRMASDDLVYENQLITSKDAQELIAKGVDLSRLDPAISDVWSSENQEVNDQESIEFSGEDALAYEGAILSNSGLLRFNASDSVTRQIYTIHLDKSLHTLLLRKNLLRKLGYVIPKIKYLKNVKIQFRNKDEINNFLKKTVPEATLGAPERWYIESLSDLENLTIRLKDVAVTMPDENDFYNLAMGVPTLATNSRTIRSLVIPYALLDFYESVNLFSWVAGKIDNKAVVLNHFTNNSFSTTKDDALWILRKLNKLTRKDFETIVKEAHFPKSVELILIEKLISRRNQLNDLFSIKVKNIAYNSKISYEASVKNGKLLLKEFPNYASRFAYSDAESPMEQAKYYAIAKIQSNIINNVIGLANEQLVTFKVGEKRVEYYQDQFKKGLDHFVKTGEFLPIGVGTWYSPTLNGQLILSRDIVLGNYLGTNNMVQLADTFGAGVDVGMILGVEGIADNLVGNVRASSSFVRSYSHIRPVKNLKESLKEPYKNMFVGLLKRSLKESFFSLAELKKINKEGQENTELRKKVEDLLKDIERNLGVGESLILTDRIMPTTSIKVNFNQGLITAGVGVSTGMAIIKRVHIYKKGPRELQIFDDKGHVTNFELSFDISKYISILKVSANSDYGKYSMNSYSVDLSSEDYHSDSFYLKALGLFHVLKNKNFEIINAYNPPNKIEAKFHDKTKGMSLAFWKLKSLTTNTTYKVKTSKGLEGKYFSYEKSYVNGINPESFAKQVMNYYVAKETEDIRILDDNASANPGNSFFGRSSNEHYRFEAEIDESNQFSEQFLAYSNEKQGWAIKKDTARKFIKNINKKFSTKLFNEDQIDFDKLRLFKIGYHFHIYTRGIKKIAALNVDDVRRLEDKYRKARGCHPTDDNYESSECGELGYLSSKITSCKKHLEKNTDNQKVATCTSQIFKSLVDSVEFEDIKSILGEQNIYIFGTIDGFREKSEILNDTIYSNTVGQIGSKKWNGPLDYVRRQLGLSEGEFSGSWMREGI